MGTMIDLLGSLIFGGALMMIILSAHDTARENQSVYCNDMIVQQSLTGVVRMVEGELRNMGSGCLSGDTVIVLVADSNKFSFRADLNHDGIPDTITYWTGPTTELLETQNEMDRKLYRHFGSGAGGNSVTDVVALVTQFHLDYENKYKDPMGPTPIPSNQLRLVNVVVVTVEVQSPFAPYRQKGTVQTGQRDAWYSSSLWQQTRLVSQNLNR
jgi:hypothetical protein